MNIHRIVGASCLAALRPGHDPRPALDEIADLGFNAIRVFCGALPWANQSIEDVYRNLPALLVEARSRSLHVYQAYHTEAGTGYNLQLHTAELEQINAGRDNVLREVANEPPHPTNQLSPERCRDLAAMMAGPVAYGADIDDDEGVRYAGGHFVAWHRNRGRDTWNDVRRQREGFAVFEATNKPLIDQEGKGAAEASIAGRREANPNYFYAQTVLARLFGFGGVVFHSDDGLLAQRLGPNQRLCAEAFVNGSRLWTGSDRLQYLNVGHGGSPVTSARFNEGRNEEGVTRAYSGVVGNEGITVGVGVVGNPGLDWGNGWRPVAVLAERPGVTVWRVER